MQRRDVLSVTSDTVPQRRMLGNAGLFVAPGDPTALATVLRALAEDRATVTALADRASQLARERFCAIAVIAPLEERLRGDPRTRFVLVTRAGPPPGCPSEALTRVPHDPTDCRRALDGVSVVGAEGGMRCTLLEWAASEQTSHPRHRGFHPAAIRQAACVEEVVQGTRKLTTSHGSNTSYSD